MRAAIDLDLFGEPVRILSEVPEAIDLIRGGLSDHILGSTGPVGFVIRAPERAGDFYCLLDRAGLILARSRSWADSVAVLTEHLAAFAPAPNGTTRVRLRAVVAERDGGVATLVGFPLLAMPPVIERRLQHQSQRLLDRLVVDVTPDATLDMTPMPWPVLHETMPVGHLRWAPREVRIDAVLLPGPASGVSSFVHTVAAIAPLIVAPPEDATTLAEKLAERAHFVPVSDAAALHAALER